MVRSGYPGGCGTPSVTAAVINSGVSPTTMSRAAVRKYKRKARPAAVAPMPNVARSNGGCRRAARTDMENLGRRSKLDHLGGVDVTAGPNFGEQFFARRGVEI